MNNQCVNFHHQWFPMCSNLKTFINLPYTHGLLCMKRIDKQKYTLMYGELTFLLKAMQAFPKSDGMLLADWFSTKLNCASACSILSPSRRQK